MTTAEKLAKVMELSYRINNETEFCSFVKFAGHVNEVGVEIASNKGDYNNDLAKAEIANPKWNKNAESQLDQLINDLQFVAQYHAIPEGLPEYSMFESYSKHGLCKTKLSSASQHNESTLQNTSTEAYMNIRDSVKEAESHATL